MNASSCIQRFMIEASCNSISMHFIYRTDLEININFFFLSIQRMINQWQLWFLEIPYNQRQLVLIYLSHWKTLPLFWLKDHPIVGGCGANITIDEIKHYKLENNYFDIISAAVPEWFAAGAFGLVTVFTLFLRNVPALQSNLLYVVHFIMFSFSSSIYFHIVELQTSICPQPGEKSTAEKFRSSFLVRY